MKGHHSAKQRVFSEEIAEGKIAVKLVKAKRIQILAFHGTDLRIRDRVRSIIQFHKRVHILRRINRFKFYNIASFIGSDTLQSLKMDLSFGKGHGQCGSSSLCKSFVCEHVGRFVQSFHFEQGNNKVHQ